MMKKKGVWRLRMLLLQGLLLPLGAGVASSQTVLFSNYSGSVGTNSYDISTDPSGDNAGWSKHAFKFQATATGDLGSITIPIEHDVGVNLVRFQIYSNAGGTPGSLLDYAIGAGVPYGSASSGSAATASFTNSFTLSSGTDYWLVVRPESTGSFHFWYEASPAQSVSHYVSKDVFNDTLTPSEWGTMTTINSGAFTLTAIPEPSTYAAAIGLVALCAVIGRSRWRKSNGVISPSRSPRQ